MVYRARFPILPHSGGCCRWFSGYCTGSILGTSTLSGSLLKTLQEDLRSENELRTKGIGETLQNCVHSAELSHMESPEADEEFSKNLNARVDDLFARIPLPQDPMKVALAPTDEEVKEEAAAELVKEAVREVYWRKLDAKQAEEIRLKRAEEKLKHQGVRECLEERLEVERLREDANTKFSSQPLAIERQSPVGKATTASPLQNVDCTLSAEELRKELAAMKAHVSRLEELLRNKR
ncbi:hypothetical protein, conserved [Leishmania tarentolae]|uniref:Uncharacterized protein n=1 Tax=Leishmania tarentolae TaxID=5689 RepID=A0A640KKX1_LEITA|nr:hypothetical protein, conserved [Leishmania tarentolae]